MNNLIYNKRYFFTIIAFLFGLCISAFSMDIVTLKDGNILKGQIIQKDSDGGFIIYLTSGSKRYVLPDEIESLENDNAPFKSDKKGTFNIPCGLSLYTSYEIYYPSKLNIYDEDFQLNNGWGLSLGVGYQIPFKIKSSRFHIIPSVEIAFAKNNKDLETNMSNFPYDIYIMEPKSNKEWSLNLKIPILVGYQFDLNRNMNVQFQTGPLIACTTRLGDKLFVKDYISHTYIDKDYDFTYTLFKYKLINVDWRLGLKFNYKKIFFGLTYNLGITNRLEKISVLENDEKNYCYPKLKYNNLQFQLGVNF